MKLRKLKKIQGKKVSWRAKRPPFKVGFTITDLSNELRLRVADQWIAGVSVNGEAQLWVFRKTIDHSVCECWPFKPSAEDLAPQPIDFGYAQPGEFLKNPKR